MVIKVIVNYPEDKDALIKLASKTIAKILVNTLKPGEINKLIEVLQKET